MLLYLSVVYYFFAVLKTVLVKGLGIVLATYIYTLGEFETSII